MGSAPEVSNAISSRSRDDDINLIELLHVVVHKRIILAVFLGFLIVGVAFALLMPKQYLYTMTIEIGTIMEDGKSMLIDQPGTLLAKINVAYIPYVIEQFAGEKGDDYKITARIPQESEVIVLESKAPEKEEVFLFKLQTQVVEYVKQNHQRVFDVMKKEMNVELDKSRNKRNALQDRHKVLAADSKRLDQTAKFLGDQIKNLKAQVADAISYRKMARSQTGDEAQAMTLMMIDNEIQQSNQRLAALEERLHIDLPREKDFLNNTISDNSREQQEQAAEIAKIRAAVNNMRETRMLIAPMRSAESVGVGRTTIVVVSAIMGLFAGIIAAFILVIFSNVRNESQTPEQVWRWG